MIDEAEGGRGVSNIPSEVNTMGHSTNVKHQGVGTLKRYVVEGGNETYQISTANMRGSERPGRGADCCQTTIEGENCV